MMNIEFVILGYIGFVFIRNLSAKRREKNIFLNSILEIIFFAIFVYLLKIFLHTG